MHTIKFLFKKSVLGGIALVLSAFSMAIPLTSPAFAQDCTPPADATYGNGVHHPTGAEATLFSYDCQSQTWVSQYYTYFPATNTKAPNYAPDYSYDCTAGKWYKTEYDFSPADGAYHKTRVVTSSPGLATGCPAPASTTAPATGTSTSGSGTSSATSDAASPTGGTINNTGAGSSNGTTNTDTTSANGTNNTVLTLGNGVNSQASSGDAGVFYNTTGGNASSGDARSLATIANLLQSSANIFGPNTALFTTDINGDVNGDFMFDPSAIMNTGTGSTNSAANNANLTLNQAKNSDIALNNTINVGSNSGDATVAGNTTGGDATSGNAAAIVNLMNLINSTVDSGKSFVGTVNINGNLNGDILLPQNLLDQLLASTGTGSSNSTSNSLNVNATDTTSSNTNINNDVNATAATGNADVSGNTQAGSATTGSAKTNVTLLNLTGSQVVGADDLLVFVNVLGHWVGMIMNAPAGTTAASLGGGITNAGTNSVNSTSNNANLTTNTTANQDLSINNKVNAHAQSGDAAVADNTTGGNAKTGNADTAVNILNVANANLNLSDWFGILFINVFGDWTGSFGVNTAAGDPVASAVTSSTAQTASSSPASQFASFIAHGVTSASSGGSGSSSQADGGDISAVLGSSTPVAKKVAAKAAAQLPAAASSSHASYLLPAVGFVTAGILLLIGERDRFFQAKK